SAAPRCATIFGSAATAQSQSKIVKHKSARARPRRCRGHRPLIFTSRRLSHDRGETLILMGRDHVDSGVERRPPTFQDGLARTKVISPIPPAILLGAETIKRIEANPETESMGVIHKCVKAVHIGRCPVAGADLATFLDLRPGVVPPSAIVRGPLYQQLL